MSRRAYEEIRNVVEERGGTMVYDPTGKRAWNISLNGKDFRAEYDSGRFPDLDECYTPRIDNPKHWSDYHLPLVPGGIDKLLGKLR